MCFFTYVKSDFDSSRTFGLYFFHILPLGVLFFPVFIGFFSFAQKLKNFKKENKKGCNLLWRNGQSRLQPKF